MFRPSPFAPTPLTPTLDEVRRQPQPLHPSLAEKSMLGPQSINASKFAEARASELRALALALKIDGETPKEPAKYPRHMRRRATSHNAYGMPVRLRCAPEGQTPAAAKRKRQQERQTAKQRGGDQKKPAAEASAAADAEPARCRRHTRRAGKLNETASSRSGARCASVDQLTHPPYHDTLCL